MEPAQGHQVDLVVINPAPPDQRIATARTQTQKRGLVHVVDRVVHGAIIGAGYSTIPVNRKSARVSRTRWANSSRVVVPPALV